MVVHLASDVDPDEAQEWLDSVDALVATHGIRRARQVLDAASRYGIDTEAPDPVDL